MSDMRILHLSRYYHPYVGGVDNICKNKLETTRAAKCS